MFKIGNRLGISSIAALAAFGIGGAANGQTAYGVNGNGLLFSFDVNTPSVVTNIGNLPFVPEGIDFRPGTNTLHAIDVGDTTTQMYTINIDSGLSSPVGAGFPTMGANYDLRNGTFGFDFNPTTLQADNSMRIRLVGTSGANLRLNSSTGLIAAVDGQLLFGNGDSPFIDAAAYINNNPTMGGTTALYDMDSRNDELLLQSPPNAGTVSTIGSFGLTIDALSGIGFDIFTPLGSSDPTIADDFAYAVLRRPDAPINGPLGAYLLYNVNLGSGQIASGALVGSSDSPYDFTGGFAINPVPTPGAIGLGLVALTGLLRRRA